MFGAPKSICHPQSGPVILPERSVPLRVLGIYISPGHNYFGRRGQAAGVHAVHRLDRVECVAGLGLKGDRFFGYRSEYKGQVTLFSQEVCSDLTEHFALRNFDPSALRRNILVQGHDLNDLIGCTFSLQGVKLAAVEECRPCFWMDQAVAPGAEEWLKGRGGLRCRILTDGWLAREAS